MSTLIKIIVTSILSLSLVSCSFNLGVKGNGNVLTKERTIDRSFDQIQVSRGLDVYLTQSETESLTVQADENLHDIIITKIEGNVLKIYADKNIRYAATQKVMVNFKNISKISASSGSDVYGTGMISADNLELESASGGDIELEVHVNSLDGIASSGSDIKIKGIAKQLYAKASSGSDIDATHLTTLTTNASSSSGADIVVNVSKELTAKAESGGDIKYLGNPEKVNTSGSVSGSVKQQ
ncbi:MAG: head GIN domain-containing protein [Gelidibacter sp.]